MLEPRPISQDLIEDIQLELKLLRRLLSQAAPVQKIIGAKTVGEVEKLAAASLLQSFYNGIENVFDALAERLDGDRPAGPHRHGVLLEQMAQRAEWRPAVITADLRGGLEQYLEFRNSYRYGHHFRLDWPLMARLVKECEPTLDRFEAELDRFMRDYAKRRLVRRPQPVGLPDYWFAPPKPRRTVDRPMVTACCALALAVGAALGVGLAAALDYYHARPPRRAPLAEIRKLTAALAEKLQPCTEHTDVRHAAGVLGFFERPDWTFTYTGDTWDQVGDVRGQCPSLGAAATLAFVGGALVRIEVATPRDRYTFAVAGKRLARATWSALPSGRPKSILELDANGLPVYAARWAEGDSGLTRYETFYADGKALFHAACGRAEPVRELMLRTGREPDEVTVFRQRDGRLVHDRTIPGPMPDLPTRPPAQSQPGR